jgi:hypothetical protein
MRRLALTLVPLCLFACSGEPTAPDPTLLREGSLAVPQSVSAANAAVRDTYRIDVPFEWVLTPTDFPCLSETIHLFGTIQEHLVFVDSKGSIHLTVHQSTNNMTAVGLTTGDTYQFSGPLTFSGSGSTSLGNELQFTFHNINHFVGPGRDSNIYFRTLVHVTRDATTGIPKVEVIKDDVLCH